MGKLKIKISDTQWQEINNLDDLTVEQLNANSLTVKTKLQTGVTPTAGDDVINKTYLDAQVKTINNNIDAQVKTINNNIDAQIKTINATIAASGGLYVANSDDLTETGGVPAEDQQNKLWIDINSATGGLKYYNGSSWVYVPVAFS